MHAGLGSNTSSVNFKIQMLKAIQLPTNAHVFDPKHGMLYQGPQTIVSQLLLTSTLKVCINFQMCLNLIPCDYSS